MDEKSSKMLIRKRSKKIITDVNLDNLKLIAETGKIVYGYREVKRVLNKSQVHAVFLAKNSREDVLSEISSICQQKGIRLIYIGTSLDMGQAIGKPFLVSAVAVLEKGEAKI